MNNIIDYQLVNVGTSSNEVPELSDSNLHYDFFMGNIILIVEGIDFSTKWNWIPLLDFYFCTLLVINCLHKNKNEDLEFTECAEKISYTLIDDETLRISSTYTDDIAETNFHDFRNDLESAYRKLLEDILGRFPDIENNQAFNKFLHI